MMKSRKDWIYDVEKEINEELLKNTDYEINLFYESAPDYDHSSLKTTVYCNGDLLAEGYQDDEKCLDAIFNMDEAFACLKLVESAAQLSVEYNKFHLEIAKSFNSTVKEGMKFFYTEINKAKKKEK